MGRRCTFHSVERPLRPIITPVGVAKNPRLTKPDTKFLEAGVYGVSLVISADAAKPVIAMIDAEMNAASELAKKDNPRVRVKAADKPYRWVANDADEPTGKVLFTFKMRASGIDRETKQPWERRPPLFNAKGKPLTNKEIGAGSEIKVAFTMGQFYHPLVGAGVSLRVQAVQLIKLVKLSGDGDAACFGFVSEEGCSQHKAPLDGQ